MTTLYRLCLLSLFGGFLIGCASTTEELILDTDRTPASEAMRKVSGNAAGITGMSGTGSVTFESPELAGSVFFTIAMRKPDSMLIRFEGPFGMDAGFFFLSRSRYVMYNGMENRVYSGVPSDAGIRWGIPMDLTVDQILDAFTGTFRFPQGMAPSQYVVDGDYFRLTYLHSSGDESFWIDPATLLVARYEKTGEPFGIRAETSLPEEQEQQRMPRQITLEFPDTGRRLSVYYSSLTMNPGTLSFKHTVPRSATSQ
jgi:outer membrane lipoprotein-sorting protein